MNIVYLTFGEKTNIHVQAYLSILSFRKQMDDSDRIIIVTTVPQFYRQARQWAEIIALEDWQIDEWKGRHNYLFRVKTKTLQMVADKYPEDSILFVDIDTVLYGRLEDMRNILNKGMGIMHKDEGHPSQMKGASLRMWHTIEGHTYGEITLSMRHHMWNSGIIGIPGVISQTIARQTLLLLDGMLDDGVECFNVEQFAMSVAMIEQLELNEAESVVVHYWGNKPEWESMAYDILAKAYMEQLSLEDAAEQLDVCKLSKTPYYIHRSSTASRLMRFIDKLFKDKDYKYL